jgi:hypothetical protein
MNTYRSFFEKFFWNNINSFPLTLLSSINTTATMQSTSRTQTEGTSSRLSNKIGTNMEGGFWSVWRTLSSLEHKHFKFLTLSLCCVLHVSHFFDINLIFFINNSDHLFDDYIKAFQKASKFLYIEHQYPFENFTLTHCLCESLKTNKNLKVIIVTAIKTDLPTGLVGELFDWSQDHSTNTSQVFQFQFCV